MPQSPWGVLAFGRRAAAGVRLHGQQRGARPAQAPGHERRRAGQRDGAARGARRAGRGRARAGRRAGAGRPGGGRPGRPRRVVRRLVAVCAPVAWAQDPPARPPPARGARLPTPCEVPASSSRAAGCAQSRVRPHAIAMQGCLLCSRSFWKLAVPSRAVPQAALAWEQRVTQHAAAPCSARELGPGNAGGPAARAAARGPGDGRQPAALPPVAEPSARPRRARRAAIGPVCGRFAQRWSSRCGLARPQPGRARRAGRCAPSQPLRWCSGETLGAARQQ